MLPPTCQMLLFSATFEESVWNFAQRIVPDPNIIKLKREEETLDTIKQYFVLCNSKEEKFQALCNIYGAITIAQAMIFCHVSSSSAQPFLTVHTTVSVSSSNNRKKQILGLYYSLAEKPTRNQVQWTQDTHPRQPIFYIINE